MGYVNTANSTTASHNPLLSHKIMTLYYSINVLSLASIIPIKIWSWTQHPFCDFINCSAQWLTCTIYLKKSSYPKIATWSKTNLKWVRKPQCRSKVNKVHHIKALKYTLCLVRNKEPLSRWIRPLENPSAARKNINPNKENMP